MKPARSGNTLRVLLIFGFRTRAYPLGWVANSCRACGRAGHLMLVREVTKLSLFFVPVLPVRTRYVLECPACRSRTRIDRREADRLRAGGLTPV